MSFVFKENLDQLVSGGKISTTIASLVLYSMYKHNPLQLTHLAQYLHTTQNYVSYLKWALYFLHETTSLILPLKTLLSFNFSYQNNKVLCIKLLIT